MTHAHHPAPTSAPVPSVLEVTLRNCHDASEYAGLETALKKVPGVTSVHLDRTRGVAHLGYEPQTGRNPNWRGSFMLTGIPATVPTASRQ